MCLDVDALTVNVGSVALVETDEILISVLGGVELARGGLLDQTLDGADEGLLVRGRVVIPLITNGGVGAVAGIPGLEDVLDDVLDLLDDMAGLVLELIVEVPGVLADLVQPRLQVGLVTGAEDGQHAEVVSTQILVLAGFGRLDVVDGAEGGERPAHLAALVQAVAHVHAGGGLLLGHGVDLAKLGQRKALLAHVQGRQRGGGRGGRAQSDGQLHDRSSLVGGAKLVSSRRGRALV